MSSSTMTASKNAKLTTKIIILRLKPALLKKFPSSVPTSATATPTKAQSDQDKASSAHGTPVPSIAGGNEDTPDPEGSKKKGTPTAKGALKRTASSTAINGMKLEKGRPGPKKKPRLADGTIDRTNDSPRPTPAAAASGPTTTGGTAGHRLGPKANTGAINEKLRALDRTGKPCRKWERKGFQLKSFTGCDWDVGSWKAPVRIPTGFSEDAKSDSSSAVDVKPTLESSAIPSESSRNGDTPAGQPNGIASSPAPIAV